MLLTAFISVWFACCPVDKKEFTIERTVAWQSTVAPEDQRSIEECPWCHVAIFARLRKMTQEQDVAVIVSTEPSPNGGTVQVEKRYTVIWERK